MKNKIEDLRNHLFEVLEALKDEDDPMDVNRAMAVSKVAQTIVNSAKIEVDFLKATGGIAGSGFIPCEPRKPGLIPTSKNNYAEIQKETEAGRRFPEGIEQGVVHRREDCIHYDNCLSKAAFANTALDCNGCKQYTKEERTVSVLLAPNYDYAKTQ